MSIRQVLKNVNHNTMNFWKVYNSSRCKMTMSILSIILVLTLCATELMQATRPILWEAFLIVMGYWFGRGTKVRDK